MTDARSTIVLLAREMAESGLNRSARAIEGRLRADGLARVHEALDNDVRRDLDQQCRSRRR